MSSTLKRNTLCAALLFALSNANAAPLVAVPAAAPSLEALAAAEANQSNLLLRAGIFDPLSQQLDLLGTGQADVETSRYAIVQFKPGQRGARQALAARGVEFLGYVPNNAYLVRLGGDAGEALRANPAVRWSGAWQPGMKLDPRLWSAERAAIPVDAFNRVEVEISLFAGESIDRFVAALRKRVPGLEISNRAERAEAPRLRVSTTKAGLDHVLDSASRVEGVLWIERYLQPQLSNAGAVAAIQGNALTLTAGSGAVGTPTPLWDHQILGSNQIVALADSGLDRNEAWFTTLNKGAGAVTAITDSSATVPPALGPTFATNKIYAYWVQPGATGYDNNVTCPGGSPTSFHGTHTSGTVVGDAAGTFGAATYVASTPTAANHELADGMAPNAQLLFQDIGNDTTGCLSGLGDLRATIEQAHAGGAQLHSDSWGSANFGAYGGNDIDVDYESWKLENFLFIVAAGNSGEHNVIFSPCPNTPVGTVCPNSVGSPGNAKNALTVGALGHAGAITIASFSSRGPTDDGRIKPDIMAPGSSTVSASGDTGNGTTAEAPVSKSMSGTSMATPTIAGNAALVRQYFSDGWYPRGVATPADTYTPSGMVMKAVLLNGTNPISPTEFAGNNFGWGRAWLDSNLWFSTTLGTGTDARRMRLFERTNAAGLRNGDNNLYTIQNVQAGQELRATLTWFDPEAVSGSAINLVNNLDLEVIGPGGTYKGNVFAAGTSTTGGVADTRNSVEQVRLIAPTAGAYVFRVIGANVPGNGRANSDTQGYALAVTAAFGLPNPAPFAAPTGLVIASNNASGVGVSFADAGGAQGFQLYRANGSCAAAQAADFRLVASAATSPVVDDRSQGGYQYAYKVRGVQNDVEGDISTCIDAVSADSCTLQPAFNEVSISPDGFNASCSVNLSWAAANANCPTSSGVNYDVLRSTVPTFASPVTVGSGVVGTSFSDAPVTNGQPYYYRMIAKDSFGNATSATRTVAVTPAGSAGPNPNGFLDDVDTHTYMTQQAPWRITGAVASAGTYSYHNAPDGLNYEADICASIETPALTIPAGVNLSFQARYNLELEWDGVVLEYSTDGGTTWLDLPPDGGYPSTFAQTGAPPVNACGYAASHGAFSGKTTAASNNAANDAAGANVFKPFTRSLSALVGQTVKLRWRFSSDPGAEFEGFWLDQVQIGNPPAAEFIFKSGFEAGEGGGSFTCQ